jgi:hypothetical protein
MVDSSDAVPPPLAVTYCPVGTLRPDPRNARTHPKQQVDPPMAGNNASVGISQNRVYKTELSDGWVGS